MSRREIGYFLLGISLAFTFLSLVEIILFLFYEIRFERKIDRKVL